jgi:hypothetical protein
MDDEAARAFSASTDLFANSIQELTVRQFAIETMLLNAIVQLAPDRALALVAVMRGGLGISGPPEAEHLKLLAEEHVQDLADRLERLVRAPKGAKATRPD